MALTIREIENAKPGGKPYKMTDGGGLCLLISPSGAKLWRWRYYFEGKEKMMAFGEYPLVSLKDAREMHFAARKGLASGIDPMAERKAEGEAKQKVVEARQREAESSFENVIARPRTLLKRQKGRPFKRPLGRDDSTEISQASFPLGRYR